MKPEKLIFRACLACFVMCLVTSAQNGAGTVFNIPGFWNNSGMNAAVVGSLNSATFGGSYQGPGGQPSSNFAEAGAVGVTAPPASATDTDTMGVYGGSTCPNNIINCEGGTFYSMAGANGVGTAVNQRVRIWGVNPVIADAGFNHILGQNEFDVNVTGPDTLAFGLSIVGASTQALNPGSVGISLGAPGPGITWPYGLVIQDGSVGVNNAAYFGLQKAATANQPSQLIRFATSDSNTQIHTSALLGYGAGGMLVAVDAENSNPSAPMYFDFGGVEKAQMNHDGSITQVGVPFATLYLEPNGTIVYCPNCTISNPCQSGGSGAFAKRLNGVSICN